MTTLHLLAPLFPRHLAQRPLPPAGSETFDAGLETLVAALVFAALFVVFGLAARGAPGGCAACGEDACGAESCPSKTADPLREETS